MLWLCYGCGYSCCISQEGGCVRADIPTRREETFLQLLLLLQQAGSLLAHALPTLGSVNGQDSWRPEQDQRAQNLMGRHLVKNIVNS